MYKTNALLYLFGMTKLIENGCVRGAVSPSLSTDMIQNTSVFHTGVNASKMTRRHEAQVWCMLQLYAWTHRRLAWQRAGQADFSSLTVQ